MSAQRRPENADLPDYVYRHRDGYRAILSRNGQLLRSPVCSSPEDASAWLEAHRDDPEAWARRPYRLPPLVRMALNEAETLLASPPDGNALRWIGRRDALLDRLRTLRGRK